MSNVVIEELSTNEEEIIDTDSVVDNEISEGSTEPVWMSYAAFFVLGLAVAFAVNLVLHVIQWNIEDAERTARNLEMLNHYKSLGVKF